MIHMIIPEEARRYGVVEALLYFHFRHEINHSKMDRTEYIIGKKTFLFTVDEIIEEFSYIHEKEIIKALHNMNERKNKGELYHPEICIHTADHIKANSYLLEFIHDPAGDYGVKQAAEEKYSYGRYQPQYVKLTETQYEELCNEYGEEFIEEIIDEINDYCGAHNKAYHLYQPVIRNWIRKKDEWYLREKHAKEQLQAAVRKSRESSTIDSTNKNNVDGQLVHNR